MKALLAALLALAAVTGARAADCAFLMSFHYPDATVTSATPVPGPSFTAPDGQRYDSVPPFCRVSATLTPTSDSLINMELWLPDPGWSGRFLGLGNGGYGGNIAIAVPAMVAALKLGIASGTTDMGTTPSSNTDADALVGHPQKWVDFGHRATHLMTVVSKEIARAFYGSAPHYAYFHGCSTGGQQALMEAQRYPDDYHGIIAGSPANNRTHLHTNVLWFYRASRALPDGYITSDKVNLITSSVVAACNVKSGGLATDAFLTDPRACDWDPASIQCTALDGPGCLLPGQVQTARAGYEGPRNPGNGHLIYPGWMRGSENASELGWNSQQSNAEPPFGSLFKWVFGPAWLWPTYDFGFDMTAVDQLLAPILNANNADLGAFQSLGGKLLAYHGTADPIINPQDTVNYYNRVLALQSKSAPLALKRTQQFFRLFLVPGMGHCSRGAGPNAFGNLFSSSIVAPPPAAIDAAHDVLLALIDWVERGNAPESIVATKYAGDSASSGVQMMRPLCPFPLFPRYTGSGDPNAAESFACASGPSVTDRTAAPEYLQ
ncbi:MAG TPA: tannase/feruloyl esterase family alpha/beta hydrolase [Burkholderiales bacterium]